MIEGLDADDKITIIATFNELKVQEGANFWSGGRMRRGLGIYIDGYLEAIYAGFNNKGQLDLSAKQLIGMIGVDSNDVAVNNRRWSYSPISNESPPLMP